MSAVRRYTVAQLSIFYRLAQDREDRESVAMAEAMGVATHGDKKVWKQYLEAMGQGD